MLHKPIFGDIMEQAGTAQLQLALECVSKDLDRVQSSLSTYEQMMLKSERVTPQLKEVVVYYREQVTGLRKEMLALCGALTSVYKRVPCSDKKQEPETPSVPCPVPVPPIPAELPPVIPAELPPVIPAELPVYVEPVHAPELPAAEPEALDPFEVQDGV
jgi:hypothetical protein